MPRRLATRGATRSVDEGSTRGDVPPPSLALNLIKADGSAPSSCTTEHFDCRSRPQLSLGLLHAARDSNPRPLHRRHRLARPGRHVRHRRGRRRARLFRPALPAGHPHRDPRVPGHGDRAAPLVQAQPELRPLVGGAEDLGRHRQRLPDAGAPAPELRGERRDGAQDGPQADRLVLRPGPEAARARLACGRRRPPLGRRRRRDRPTREPALGAPPAAGAGPFRPRRGWTTDRLPARRHRRHALSPHRLHGQSGAHQEHGLSPDVPGIPAHVHLRLRRGPLALLGGGGGPLGHHGHHHHRRPLVPPEERGGRNAGSLLEPAHRHGRHGHRADDRESTCSSSSTRSPSPSRSRPTASTSCDEPAVVSAARRRAHRRSSLRRDPRSGG